MNVRYSKYLKEINLVGDILFLNIAYLLVYAWDGGSIDALTKTRYFELMLIYNIAWLVSAYMVRLHDVHRTTSFERLLRRLLNALALFLVIIFAYLGIKGNSFDKTFIFKSYIIVSFFLSAFNILLVLFLKYYRRVGYNYRNVAIVGYGEIAKELRRFFVFHPEHGYKFYGYFDEENDNSAVRGNIRALENMAAAQNIHEIYCCLPYMEPKQVAELVQFGEDNFIKVRVIPDFRGFPYQGVEVDLYDFIPVLNFRPTPLDDGFNNFIKRTFDILFSSFVLIFIMSWAMPLIGLLIKLDSKGGILFIQDRSGRNNVPFKCYKFRTMKVNVESDLKQATKGDTRITKVGAFLRKTNLDELPQFINVFKGEMSVVGPRPHMLKHTEEFSQQVDRFMIRHHVKPGITGLAQAKGYRGETNTESKLKNRIKLDRFYVENWSLIFDVKIILMTITSMIRGDENAY